MLIKSPLGLLQIFAGKKGIRGVLFRRGKKNSLMEEILYKEEEYVLQWLRGYFNGEEKPFPWKYFDLSDKTRLEIKVWQVLHQIPFGKVKSYGDIANMIGVPKGARAVGQANRRNPCPILIPCHRVIASDGTSGGYSGGITMKRKLLKHEGVNL